MTYPVIFGTLAAGNQPVSDFDTMFNIAGQQGNIPCVATGTNAITLTPGTNYYVPAAYTNGQLVSWKAAATSTGAVTMQIGGLGLLNYYTAAGAQANSGDIVINTNYLSQYLSSLNSGAGGFQTLNASVTAIANPIQGTFKNLVLTVAGNTTMTPTADELVLQNAAGGTVRVSAYAPPATSTATVGANGLDSGTVATSTWYAWYAIYNASTATAAGLFSTSFTSPTLPSGYTYSALLGAFITDGSTNLVQILQKGRRGQYVVGTNPTIMPRIQATGTGTYSTTAPSLASISISAFAPPNTAVIYVIADGLGTTSGILVAPNTSYGGANNGPAGTNGQTYPIWIGANGSSATASILLESTNLGIATTGSGYVSCSGWDLNL